MVTINGGRVLAGGVALIRSGRTIRVDSEVWPIPVEPHHETGGFGTDGEGGYLALIPRGGPQVKEGSFGAGGGQVSAFVYVEHVGPGVSRLSYTFTAQDF